MKMYLLLIVSAIMLSFMTAYHFIGLQSETTASSQEIEKIFSVFEKFSVEHKPKSEIDILQIYPHNRYVQLFTNLNVIETGRMNLRNYFFGGCQKRNQRMSKVFYTKSDIWEDFRCRKISQLPYRFFENPPYIHETGMSYAFLALQLEPNAQLQIDWIKDHINLFHVSELSSLPRVALGPQFEILSYLNRRELDLVGRGANYVLGDRYFLAKDAESYSLSYKVYSASDFESYLKANNYYVKPAKKSGVCFYRYGGHCYEKDTYGVLVFIRQSSIILLISSIVVLGIISLMLLKKIRESKFEEERKRHALRVLTHELRTPIANLILLTEEINKKSDNFTNEALEDLLKIESEVYRLKRLAEKSTSYLSNQEGRNLINLHFQPVESFFELINDILSDYSNNIKLNLIGNDFKVSLDIYWFTMCLKNLIENAIKYGKGQITVSVRLDKSEYIVIVEDQGNIGNIKLSSLMNNNKEVLPTSGLGLGLSLVDKILSQMNGKLSVKGSPTRFIMTIKLDNKENSQMY